MLRQLRILVIGVVGVFVAVVLGLAGYTAASGAGQRLVVFAPGGVEAALVAIAAADGEVVEVRDGQVIAISDSPAFVPRLYRAGALLVLVAAGGGCGFVLPSASGESAA